MTEAVVELGVNVTEQLDEVLVAPTRLQLVALNVPAPPVDVNATVPKGILAPAPLVSATVAAHVEGWLIGTVAGLQTTVVDVVLLVPVTEPLVVPLLALPA